MERSAIRDCFVSLRDRPALQKPFQLETLAQVIASTMKSAPV
jgi:hypothetical protein